MNAERLDWMLYCFFERQVGVVAWAIQLSDIGNLIPLTLLVNSDESLPL
jgi:hypothetical protein